MDNMNGRNQVYEVYKNLTACNICDGCVFHTLRTYIDKVGFEAFVEELVHGRLPYEVGHAYQLKVEAIAYHKANG